MAAPDPIRYLVQAGIGSLNASAARKQKASIEYDLVGPVRFGWMVSGYERALAPAYAALCRLRDPVGVVHSLAIGVKALGPVSRKHLADPVFFCEEGASWLTAPPDGVTARARSAAEAFKSTTAAYWSDGPPKRMLAAAGSLTDQMLLSCGRDTGSPSKPGCGDFRWLGYLTPPERASRVSTLPSHHMTVLLAKDRPLDGFHRYALMTALLSEWAAWHPAWRTTTTLDAPPPPMAVTLRGGLPMRRRR